METQQSLHGELGMVPEDFICPLTLNIMHDPVMDKTGRSFERRAILEWLGRGNFTCPLTRNKLGLSDLVSNHALQVRIQKWKLERRCHDDNTDDETEDNSDGDDEGDSATPLGLSHIYISPESLIRFYARLDVNRQREHLWQRATSFSRPGNRRTNAGSHSSSRGQTNSNSSNRTWWNRLLHENPGSNTDQLQQIISNHSRSLGRAASRSNEDQPHHHHHHHHQNNHLSNDISSDRQTRRDHRH